MAVHVAVLWGSTATNTAAALGQGRGHLVVKDVATWWFLGSLGRDMAIAVVENHV